MTETISGSLNVSRVRKRRSRDSLADMLAMALEDAGHLERREYPPDYFVETERRRHPGGQGLYFYKFRGQPKALRRDMEGWRITVRATMDEWPNRFGAHLTRPHILELSDPKENPS